MDGHERLMCINAESFSYLQVDKTSTLHAINYHSVKFHGIKFLFEINFWSSTAIIKLLTCMCIINDMLPLFKQRLKNVETSFHAQFNLFQ